MNPIMHDSYEWRQLQETLGKISSTQAHLDSELQLLKNQQSFQHGENRDKIKDITDGVKELDLLINGDGTTDNPGLSKQVDRMVIISQTTLRVLGVIGALLTLIFLGGTLYVAYFEAHHKITEEHRPEVSQQQHPQLSIK